MKVLGICGSGELFFGCLLSCVVRLVVGICRDLWMREVVMWCSALRRWGDSSNICCFSRRGIGHVLHRGHEHMGYSPVA